MRLGIVIVSYRVRELLRGCLNAVLADLARSPELAAEVVVVDNASDDGSAEMVAATFPQVRLIASPTNRGFAGGNNLALRAWGCDRMPLPPTAPEAVLLLNPDTEVRPGALRAMTAFLANHPTAGGCGARLFYGDGSFQHSAFRFPGLIQLWLDLFPPRGRWAGRLLDARLNGRYPRRWYEGDRPFRVDFVLGAALMVRTAAVAAVGLLDEGYFMYAEEMDWCRRLSAAGWPLYCVPTAHITHHEGRSTRQARPAMTVALWRSRLRYYDRYYPAWKRRAARAVIGLGMRAQIRRAQREHAAGRLTASAYQAHIEACREVLALL